MSNEEKKQKYGYIPVGGIKNDEDFIHHTCLFALDGVETSNSSNYQKLVQLLPIEMMCETDLKDYPELLDDFKSNLNQLKKTLYEKPIHE